MTMNKNLVRKLNNSKGVTLAEILITIVLLLLVAGMITTAIDLGVNSFNKLNKAAEGKILCAALATAAKDELRYAKNIEGSGFSDLKFFSTNISSKNCGFAVTDEDGNPSASGSGYIMLSTPAGNYDLVPKKTYVYDLKAKFTEFAYDPAASPNPTFQVGIQVVTPDDQTIAEEEFVVEPFNR